MGRRIKTGRGRGTAKRGGRDAKTSVICISLMLNGCSWIKNFQLLSARWRRTGEGEKKIGDCGGGGGASAACLRLYISPGFGNQTQEKPTASKHTLGASRALPIFRQRKHSAMIVPHLFMLFFLFFLPLLFFPPVRGGGRHLDLPGQLAEKRGSVHGSLDPSPYNQPTVWSAGPGVPPAHHG